MENNQVILLKLNRFLFFTDQQFPILPSSSNNLPTSISTIFTAIPNFFISIFTSIFNYFSSIFTSFSNIFPSVSNFFVPIFHHVGQFFTAIPNLITSLSQKPDEIPPETRISILTITIECVAVILLLILLYYFFKSCGGCGLAAGLMKAPGIGGLNMSRALFEGAPKAFFAASRAGGQLVVRAGQVVSFPGA